MASKRPRRGTGRNVLVSGDTGPRQPQGGARPPAGEWRESGDLESREFGVPEADLPGGVRHVINAETRHEKPVPRPERPADYHKYHGVASDDGQYETPPADVGRPPAAVPVPKVSDAVPVRIVEGEKPRAIRALFTEGPVTIAAGTTDPVRLADRDPRRIKFWIMNEASSFGAGVRIGDWETTADGRGLQIPGNSSPRDFVTQDAVFAINVGGSAVTISWGYETEIEAAGA